MPRAAPAQSCQVKWACVRKIMMLMARSSPGLFELVEARTVEDMTTGTELETVPRETPALPLTLPEGTATTPTGGDASSWSPNTSYQITAEGQSRRERLSPHRALLGAGREGGD